MTAAAQRRQTTGPAGGHAPVLLDEVLAALRPADGEIHVDGTFGAGGYARGLLEAAACRVYGLDRDPRAVAIGRRMAEEFPGRLVVLAGCFADMESLLAEQGVPAVDGVALDLGVSSLQLDDPERGFSFLRDGPLDMRMGGEGPSAADVVNRTAEAALADIIYRYGEERRSRAVARAIVAARARAPIERTRQLADIVAGVVRGRPGHHPATRTFQALRIYVNAELDQLERGLAAAERLLRPEGRLAVVSFHSLEDRATKQFLAQRTGIGPRPSRHAPPPPRGDGRVPSFRFLFRGARRPGANEVAANPRARSARLRAAVRTAAPPWETEAAT